jgi:hypothetical protein
VLWGRGGLAKSYMEAFAANRYITVLIQIARRLHGNQVFMLSQDETAKVRAFAKPRQCLCLSVIVSLSFPYAGLVPLSVSVSPLLLSSCLYLPLLLAECHLASPSSLGRVTVARGASARALIGPG